MMNLPNVVVQSESETVRNVVTHSAVTRHDVCAHPLCDPLVAATPVVWAGTVHGRGRVDRQPGHRGAVPAAGEPNVMQGGWRSTPVEIPRRRTALSIEDPPCHSIPFTVNPRDTVVSVPLTRDTHSSIPTGGPLWRYVDPDLTGRRRVQDRD
jgi:hypothetical protein